MIKVYYLDSVLAFGTYNEFEESVWTSPPNCESSSCSLLDMSETKMAFFFGKSKKIAIKFHMSEQATEAFDKFCSHFMTIEAGGGAVRSPNGDTLMIFRNGLWDLPKGKREPGESIQQCALREVEEECAISELTLGCFLCSTFHIYKLHEQWILKRTTWFEMHHSGVGQLAPQREEGITKVRWVSSPQLAGYMEDTYSTIRDVISYLDV